MTDSQSPREISSVVRAAILHELWERGDQLKSLSSTKLKLSEEQEPFFEGSVDWLENEGLIRVGNKQTYNDRPPQYASAQLTKKGEVFLSQTPDGYLQKVGSFLKERVGDLSKQSFNQLAIDASREVWELYEKFKDTPSL